MNYPTHEVANLFPMMSEDEFSALVDDIRENGLREPIWIYQRKIIDGRNRYAACERLGIQPETREWNGSGSLVSFVISLNLKRRHLSNAQKAAVAVDMLPLLEQEARERQRLAGGDRKSEVFQKSLPQKIAEAINDHNEGESREQAAKLVGTNRQYVSDAKKIQQEAPEVFDMMKRGEVNMQKAKQIASIPEETRTKVLDNLQNQVVGKTKVCTGCGELLPVERFDLSSGYSKCNSCKWKEQKSREANKQDMSQKDQPISLLDSLKKKVKDLEAEVQELKEKCRQYEIDNYELRNELIVTKANAKKYLVEESAVCKLQKMYRLKM